MRKLYDEQEIPFPDHYDFSPQDFSQFKSKGIVMTEKDAVKCRAFAKDNWYYLPVDAQLPERFSQDFLTHFPAPESTSK